jgi:hypothetical protein
MKKDELDEQIEESLRANSHKTTKQKIRLLKLNKYFQKDILDLRIKHKDVIKEYISGYEKVIKDLNNKLFTKALEDQIKNNAENTEQAWSLVSESIKKLSKEKNNERDNILIEIVRILKDDNFNEDIITICEKYKLYPIENWLQPIMVYIGFNHMVPSDFLLGAGLDGYLSREEILHLPQDMNFSLKIEANKITGEKELFIKVFDDTTLKHDLRKHWHIVEKLQKLLRKEKGVKRFHVLKNLPIMEKLSESKDKIYDPVLGREVKITDIDRALEIYENTPWNKKEEIKAGKRLEQIKRRQKPKKL